MYKKKGIEMFCRRSLTCIALAISFSRPDTVLASCLDEKQSSGAAQAQKDFRSPTQLADQASAKILEEAAGKYKTPEEFAEAVEATFGKYKPAPNPADKDEFGIEVDPFSKMPGALTAFRDVADAFIDPKALMNALFASGQKRRIFEDMVTRRRLIETLQNNYRLRAAAGLTNDKERGETIERLGDLIDRNDSRAGLYFGTDLFRKQYAGVVRAKQKIDEIDDEIQVKNIKDKALELHNFLQKSDSYYKNLTLEELECRMGFPDWTDAEERRQETNRRLFERYKLQKSVKESGPSIALQGIRPMTADDILGPPGSQQNRPPAPLIPNYGGGGNASESGSDYTLQLIIDQRDKAPEESEYRGDGPGLIRP